MTEVHIPGYEKQRIRNALLWIPPLLFAFTIGRWLRPKRYPFTEGASVIAQLPMSDELPHSGQKPDDDFFVWALKKRYDDAIAQFRAIWDIYIKWYTAFIAFNVAALVFYFTAQLHKSPWRLCVAIFFIVQNLMCIATSSMMCAFSSNCTNQARRALRELQQRWSPQKEVPHSSILASDLLPCLLPRLGAVFNAIGAFLLLAIWLLVAVVKF